MSDFEADTSLGKGAYGKVIKVKYRKNKKYYAMKVVAKSTIETYHMKDQLKNEVSILSKLSHPRIIQLYTIFEDHKNIYFLMELAEGGQLYIRMQQSKGKFEEKLAAKYAFDVFKAVDYLHKQNPPIIHRDIKPENILFCENDVLKLADFGWSNLKDQVRHTFCGTPEYLAPEMLMEKGHNEKLDVWCLGVLLYEIMAGKAPFTPSTEGKNKKEIEEQLKANIVTGKIKFPSSFSTEAIDLLEKLLQRKPGDRVSCEEAMLHPFFKQHGLEYEPYLGDSPAEKAIKTGVSHGTALKPVSHKMAPKELKDSDVPLPNISSASKAGQPPPKPGVNLESSGVEASLELTQSMVMTDSQLQTLSLIKEQKFPRKCAETQTEPTEAFQGEISGLTELDSSQISQAVSNATAKQLALIEELETKVRVREEELGRMSRIYEEEKEHRKALEDKVQEQEKTILEMTIKMAGGSQILEVSNSHILNESKPDEASFSVNHSESESNQEYHTRFMESEDCEASHVSQKNGPSQKLQQLEADFS